MKLVAKWVIGIGIGVLFVWLAVRSRGFDRILDFDTYPLRLEGTVLIAGAADPEVDQYLIEVAAISGGAEAPDGEAAAGATAGPQGWYFDLIYLLPYFAFLTLIHFLRVIRWYPLLRPLARIGFWELNRIGAVGFMSVFIFPLRLGEFVRPYLIAQRTKVRMSEALATIVVERVMDGLMTSLVLFIVLLFLPRWNRESYATIMLGAFIALGVFVGGMSMLVLAYWRRNWTMQILRRFVGRFSRSVAERIISIIEAFFRGLSVLPDWRNFALFTLITAVYWGLNGIGLYIFCRAFGINIPLLGAYAMMTCVVVGMMIPNSPANVGSFWVFLLMPLALYGVHDDSLQATACGLATWLVQLGQLVLFAGYFFVTGKISFRSVWHASRGKRPGDARLATDRVTSSDGA